MVQILVHVRPADSKRNQHFELLDCSLSTTVGQIKQQIQEVGTASGVYALPVEQQELVFLEERCEDEKSLKDYGINNEFIVQVTGFVVNPDKPGKRFESGVLVPSP